VPGERHAAYLYKTENNVHCTLMTGTGGFGTPNHRLIGTDGIIEVGLEGGLDLRLMNAQAAGWQPFPEKGIHGDNHIDMGILTWSRRLT
jgi:hypothetical protein